LKTTTTLALLESEVIRLALEYPVVGSYRAAKRGLETVVRKGESCMSITLCDE
jgi:hypothetical protein